MLTPKTLTAHQISTLRSEAERAGDHEMILLCDLAVAPFEDKNTDGSPLIGPCGGQTTRTEAREAVIEALIEATVARPRRR